MIEGLLICTLHCAPAVFPSLEHMSAYVAVFAPAGGFAIVAVVVPEGCVVTVKPVLEAVPAAHE